MNDYQIGIFAYFEFTLVKKAYGQLLTTSISTYGTIIDIDSKNILIADSRDPNIEYMPAKVRITKFEVKDKLI
jgi:hypothetical protein